MATVLRSFTTGELLDGGFTIYRRNFLAFFAAALIPQVPIIVLWLVLPAFIGTGSAAQGAIQAASLLVLPYSLLAIALSAAALTYATARAYSGADVSAGDALRQGLSRVAAVFIALFSYLIAVITGVLFFVIPGLIFLAMFFAAVPVIMIERRGPFEALGRSRQLSRGGRTRVLGVLMLTWLITFLPALAFYVIAGVALGTQAVVTGDTAALADSGWFGALTQAVGVVVGALTTPFFVAVTTLLYIDRRARTEAPDLEAAADRLAHTD
jgi:hypothetical protein